MFFFYNCVLNSLSLTDSQQWNEPYRPTVQLPYITEVDNKEKSNPDHIAGILFIEPADTLC